ncbi:toll/interleukin-1 receptor domain-containing protein [Photobacterium phosphoreum]|uniref:toll/interleukin-1 receptor domain-containing protein n=1 Tax=Photobacterium phosphoreum TaxID=659 RepID=UPI0024B723E2|nr:toll/interleukin-1 receptor domain-containing protein [Photobacterium phosphoreum]
MKKEKVLFSYSWDGDEHQSWVVHIANQLRNSGVDAEVDVFLMRENVNLYRMMVEAVKNSDYIIIVLTEGYKEKVDNNTGGVSFESTLLLNYVSSMSDHSKLIFIMKHNGDYTKVFPFQYGGFYAIDFSEREKESIKLKELLYKIKNKPLFTKAELGETPELLPINSLYLGNNKTKTLESKSVFLGQDKDIIYIDNNIDLILNIKSNSTLYLKQGIYNITDLVDVENDNIEWINCYDGMYPRISNIDGLTINADIGTTILIDPRYAFVFDFSNCNNVKIKNIIFGHTDSGYCVGGVLGFSECRYINITDSVLFGCGTIGVCLYKVNDFIFSDSIIKECTYSLVEINESTNIYFKHSTFKETKEFALFEIKNSKEVYIESSSIVFNKTSEYQPYLFSVDKNSDPLKVIKTEIKYNEVKYLIDNKEMAQFINCQFKGNDFSLDEIEQIIEIESHQDIPC